MTTHKSKFEIFGQTGLILVLAVCVLAAFLRAAIGFMQYDDQRQNYFLLEALLGICILAYLWQIIVKEINQIRITDSEIILTNLLNRTTTVFRKNDLKGYRDTHKNGYKILLIDKSNNVVGKVHEKYYVDFKNVVEDLDLKYLGGSNIKDAEV